MELTHHGFVFNTDNMTSYATGAPASPVIYMNENGLAFLQSFRKFWPHPRYRYMTRLETRRIAVLYGMPELLAQLNRCPTAMMAREVAAPERALTSSSI